MSDNPKEECGVFGVSIPSGEDAAQLAFFGSVRPAAPRPGGRRHGGVRRAPRPHPQRRRSRHQRVHRRGHAAAGRRARHRAHPLLHHRLVVRPQRPTVPRRDATTAPSRSVTTATWSTRPNCATTCSTRGFGLTATSDTEVLTLMLAAAYRLDVGRPPRTHDGVVAWRLLAGACSAADRVLAVRDPWGFRPLSVGRLPGGGHAVASETCALRTLGCDEISDVEPGEIVTLQGDELRRRAGAGAGAQAGALHVRVRVLLPARLGVGRRERARRAPAPRRGTGPRAPGRRRRRHPGPRLVDPGRHRLRPGERHSLQRRLHQEPLHRSHVHRADPAAVAPRAWRSSSTRSPRTSPAGGS